MQKSFSSLPGPLPSQLNNWAENIFNFAKSPLPYLEEMQKTYGDMFTLTRHCAAALSIPNCAGAIVALGPFYNRAVLMNRQTFHSAKPEEIRHVSTAATHALSYSLRTHSPEQHKKSRKLFTPLFSSKKTDFYQTEILACAHDVLSCWEHNQVIDLEQEIKSACFYLTNGVIFGEKGLHSNLAQSFYGLLAIRRQSDLAEDPAEKEQRMKLFLEEADRVTAHLRDIIKNVRQAQSGSGIFASLCLLKNDDGFAISEEELIGTANSLTLSSVDTITAALCWTLFLISIFPEWEEKLLQEIQKRGDKLFLNFQEMQILDHILKESLRLLPPSSLLLRRTVTEFELGEYLIPPDTEVILSPYMTHRMGATYSRPNRFLPQRWESIQPDVFEYIPFSAGPKSCLGESLAISQMKIFLLMIFKSYRLKFLEENVVDWSVSTILKPANAIKMQIQALAKVGHAKEKTNKKPIKVCGTINELIDLS